MCCLLGYYLDEWVDKPILGFLSIFSIEEKAIIQFNFSQFLADKIHEQLFSFPTEGMCRDSLIFPYMFIFFQTEKFPFFIHKFDLDGK
jgi:hypothetical protein